MLTAIGFAAQAMIVRVASHRGRTVDTLLVVIAVNAVVLVPLAFVLVDELVVTSTAVIVFFGSGIIATLVGRGLLYAGIDRVGASRAEPIKASTPLHATVLAVLLLGESVSLPQWFGILLVVVGLALVTWEGSRTDPAHTSERPWFGLALPLAAALLFGLEPVLAQTGFAEGTSALVGLAIKTVAALSVYLWYLTWQGDCPTIGSLQSGPLRWYLLAGLVNTGTLVVYYSGLAVSRVGVFVPIMQTSPLLVLLGSAIFLNRLERVTIQVIAGATMVVAGAIAVTLAG